MFKIVNPKKKALGLLGAIVIITMMLPLFAAFEAHVINVKAQIEEALDVSPGHIDFGPVFPQETLEATFAVALSESFMSTSRTVDVEYEIIQTLKPVPDTSPVTHYKDLRPFIYKIKDISETDSDSETVAGLDQSLDDLIDNWKVELHVPCISSSQCKDHGTPACPTYPCGGPRHDTCQMVDEDPVGSGGAGQWGADIWVQVTGISYFAKPQVSSIAPDRGVIGTSVLIRGTGFGASQGTGEVSFDGQTAGVSSWSDTAIQVIVPPGAATGPVIVTTAGGPSGSVNFTVLPQMVSLSPTWAYTGNVVTINGSGFGVSGPGSQVTFRGVPASIVSWGHNQIRARVPAAAITGPVTVRTSAGLVSNSLLFTVRPRIVSLSPPSGPVNSVVTINGLGFGTTLGAVQVYFGGVSATVLSVNPNTVLVRVPSRPPGGTTVLVRVLSVPSNSLPFTVL